MEMTVFRSALRECGSVVLRLCAVLSFLGGPSLGEEILVLRADGPKFQEAVKGLRQELGTEFRVEDRVLGSKEGAAEMEGSIRARRPKALVLMDNHAIAVFAEVRRRWKDSLSCPPSVALMGIRVDRAIRGMTQVTGITYEVPALTTFLNLRTVLSEPIHRVGVIHRPEMADLVSESSKWCRQEKITLIPFVVPDSEKDASGAIRRGIWHLRKTEKVDALWVLNDNVLLTMDAIRKGWLPALERFRKPVIVGVESLVEPGIAFGAFAVLPDDYGLGVQAGGLIRQMREDGWRVREGGQLEHSMSVLKILNLRIARRNFKIDESRLGEMDRILE